MPKVYQRYKELKSHTNSIKANVRCVIFSRNSHILSFGTLWREVHGLITFPPLLPVERIEFFHMTPSGSHVSCNDIHIDLFASSLIFMTDIAMVTVQTMLSGFDL